VRRAAALILIAAAGCGGGSKLKVELYDNPQTGRELLVSVPEEVNVPETAGDSEQVRLQCFDRRSRKIIDELHTWPFETDGAGNDLPHAHQNGLPQLLNRGARCRLVGTDPTLEGELPLAQ